MGTGDILRQLFEGYARHSDAEMRAAAEALIRDERAKNHRLLADDLERILLSSSSLPSDRRPPSRFDVPRDRDSGFPLLDISYPRDGWERLVVSARTQQALEQIAREHSRRALLATAGLAPKQRVLFYGPPGCGKTLAARVVAGVLGFPLALVRFDAVVSSLLGATAGNLRRIFDFLATDRWVILFDEFDAIGKERDNPFEHGELKRLVNSLLQLMDSFRGESLLIAATNHESLLDAAIWRRFEAAIPFTAPTEAQRLVLLRHFLRSFDSSGVNLAALSKRLRDATGADIEWITIEAARYAVLDHRVAILQGDLALALASYRDRKTVQRRAETHNPEPVEAGPDEPDGP